MDSEHLWSLNTSVFVCKCKNSSFLVESQLFIFWKWRKHSSSVSLHMWKQGLKVHVQHSEKVQYSANVQYAMKWNIQKVCNIKQMCNISAMVYCYILLCLTVLKVFCFMLIFRGKTKYVLLYSYFIFMYFAPKLLLFTFVSIFNYCLICFNISSGLLLKFFAITIMESILFY